jgi:hypothetical protein
MEFFGNTAKYMLYDHNESEEVRIQSVLEKINNYKSERMQHVWRVDRSRLLNAVVKYQPEEKRSPGLPLKGLLFETDFTLISYTFMNSKIH